MKILFIGSYYYFENTALMYLAGYLKKHGHICYYLDLKLEKDIVAEILKIKPHIIAYNMITGFGNRFIEINKKIKTKHDYVAVFGGPHCTLFPELIHEDGVDAVCRGDGEIPLLELAEALENGQDIRFIKNFWIKIESDIFKNELRECEYNIDTITFPDRAVFDRYRQYRKLSRRSVNTSRGCAFNCSFCYSNALKNIMGVKHGGFRQRSVENVIDELQYLKNTYAPKRIKFIDDILIYKKDWAFDFLKQYKLSIGIPFFACIRIDLIDEPLIAALKDAGCLLVEYGIECGNEQTRITLLNRKITNAKIIENSLLFKKYGIKTMALNMVGLPGETMHDCMETIEINIVSKVTFAHTVTYMPFPGTKLCNQTIESGLFDGDINRVNFNFMYSESPLKNYQNNEIKRLQYLASTVVSIPILYRILPFLVKLKLKPLYVAVFFVHRVINQLFISRQHLIRDFIR